MKKLQKNKKIGLALGGGAVLGAAHIGVLKALEELEIEIGWITGTSIGSLVASLYAFGVDCNKVQDLAIDLSWSDIAGFSLSKFGLLSNKNIQKFLQKHIGDATFDQANIPLAVIATNITTGQKVVLNKGKVAYAVMASCCIPGIFKPVTINDILLVDGGIVENVPVSPLKDLGADFSIAVDLNAKYTNKKPENIVDVLLNSFHFTLATATKFQTEKANILIQPDLSSFSRLDINQNGDLIKMGYKETIKTLKDMVAQRTIT